MISMHLRQSISLAEAVNVYKSFLIPIQNKFHCVYYYGTGSHKYWMCYHTAIFLLRGNILLTLLMRALSSTALQISLTPERWCAKTSGRNIVVLHLIITYIYTSKERLQCHEYTLYNPRTCCDQANQMFEFKMDTVVVITYGKGVRLMLCVEVSLNNICIG